MARQTEKLKLSKMKKAEKLQNELPKLLTLDKEYNEVKILPTSFIKNETLYISAEDGNGFADYYNLLYIDPELEKWAEKRGLYWDWEDAGSIMLGEA